ncbi:hypothetical protein QOT17_002105 [Balamuthia mandrillaris]
MLMEEETWLDSEDEWIVPSPLRALRGSGEWILPANSGRRKSLPDDKESYLVVHELAQHAARARRRPLSCDLSHHMKVQSLAAETKHPNHQHHNKQQKTEAKTPDELPPLECTATGFTRPRSRSLHASFSPRDNTITDTIDAGSKPNAAEHSRPKLSFSDSSDMGMDLKTLEEKTRKRYYKQLKKQKNKGNFVVGRALWHNILHLPRKGMVVLASSNSSPAIDLDFYGKDKAHTKHKTKTGVLKPKRNNTPDKIIRERRTNLPPLKDGEGSDESTEGEAGGGYDSDSGVVIRPKRDRARQRTISQPKEATKRRPRATLWELEEIEEEGEETCVQKGMALGGRNKCPPEEGAAVYLPNKKERKISRQELSHAVPTSCRRASSGHASPISTRKQTKPADQENDSEPITERRRGRRHTYAVGQGREPKVLPQLVLQGFSG